MTTAPADRPCGCDQSQALTQDLADARTQLEAQAEDNRELFEQLAAANARVAELEAQLAGKVEMVANWKILFDDLAGKYKTDLAELSALRSRLYPERVEMVERMAEVMAGDEEPSERDLENCRACGSAPVSRKGDRPRMFGRGCLNAACPAPMTYGWNATQEDADDGWNRTQRGERWDADADPDPCNCPQARALTRDLTSLRCRADELRVSLHAAKAELAALRSRLDPGSVEAVERVAKALASGRRYGRPLVTFNERALARVVLAALSGGG